MNEPKKIGLSFLAYGEEHIKKLGILLKNFNNSVDIYIAKDLNSIIENIDYKIIEIDEPFNYNLKRFSIRESLIYHNTVLFIDVDTKVKNYNFKLLNNLKEGVYVNWVNNIDNVLYDEQITLQGIIDGKIKTCIDSDYFNKLKLISKTDVDILFIRESFFIINLLDINKKEKFIKNWDKLVHDINFNNLSNNKQGIMEGFLIYLSCILSDIKVYDIQKNKSVKMFYNNFIHLGDYKMKDLSNSKTLI
jgi:hypothetical protein